MDKKIEKKYSFSLYSDTDIFIKDIMSTICSHFNIHEIEIKIYEINQRNNITYYLLKTLQNNETETIKDFRELIKQTNNSIYGKLIPNEIYAERLKENSIFLISLLKLIDNYPKR